MKLLNSALGSKYYLYYQKNTVPILLYNFTVGNAAMVGLRRKD